MDIIVYRKWLEKLEKDNVKVKMLKEKMLNKVPILKLTILEQSEALDDNL
jgi:hypothetical protein